MEGDVFQRQSLASKMTLMNAGDLVCTHDDSVYAMKELQGDDLRNPETWTASTHEADWHIVSTGGVRSEVWAQCAAAAVIARDLQALLTLSSEGVATVGTCTDSFLRILDMGCCDGFSSPQSQSLCRKSSSKYGATANSQQDKLIFTPAQRLALLHLTQEMQSLQVNLVATLARATRLASKLSQVTHTF